MASPPALDETDRAILHLLQVDARNTASNIADEVGVAPNTVRNRINRLEENDVIVGYHPQINYEKAGFQLHIALTCTVPVSTRRQLAENASKIEGVIGITEILSGTENMVIEVVGTDGDDITRIATALEGEGLKIQNERIIISDYVQPFNHFGASAIEG